MKMIKSYVVKKLTSEIYALNQGGVCIFLIIGKTYALVFDTGAGLSDPMPAIRKLTDKPLYVVNSHGHYDHSAGNSFFESPVYMHEADREVYERHNSSALRKIAAQRLKAAQRRFFYLPVIPRHFNESIYIHTPLFTNFRYVHEKDSFDLGGMSAQVIEIPGHTPGSIGLLIPERKIFLAGDGLNSGTWLFLPESTKLSVYQETVRKVEKLDFEYLITGHSFDMLPKSVMEEYKAVAEKPDFAGGEIQPENPFAPGVIPRVCHALGSGREHKATIMISQDKL